MGINFTELDKEANMEFIKKAEKEFDREQWERVHKEYEAFPAPYKELLPEHMEIGISLNDFENTKDKGLY